MARELDWQCEQNSNQKSVYIEIQILDEKPMTTEIPQTICD